MAESKYAKYVVPAPIRQSTFKQIIYPELVVRGNEHLNGMPFSMGWEIMAEPITLVEDAHSHSYNQVFCFVGSNIEDINDFDAEIWMYLGEEQEKMVITSPTTIWVPGGMMHCPLIFRRVGKPFMYMDFPLTAEPKLPPVPKASQR